MQKGDEKLHVEFRRELWQNPSESLLQGRPIFQEREWVRILIPGDNCNQINTLVEDHHKLRFPTLYEQFVNSREDQNTINGTPLSSWSAITREVAEKLRYKKFFTIEQVSTASDTQLNSIGMDVGMQPHDFRKLAIAYLESAGKTGEIMRREAELDLIRHDNSDLRAQNIEQANRIKDLERSVSHLLLATTPAEKPKRAPKAKAVEQSPEQATQEE